MADNIVKLADLQDAGELPVDSEDALALTYAERHANDSRYVAAWARWLLYDGARWSFDTTLHAFDRARAICREVALECAKPAAVMTAKTVRRRRAACPRRSPSCCHGRAMGREPYAACHSGRRRYPGCDLRSGHRTGAHAGSARLHDQGDCLQRGAFRHTSPAVERISRSHHGRRHGTAGLPAALRRILLHGPHDRACVRFCLRHRSQRQEHIYQHHRPHLRRLRRGCGHGHVHCEQHRAPPDRSGQAARRPPGCCAGNPERPPLGRDQDQSPDRW